MRYPTMNLQRFLVIFLAALTLVLAGCVPLVLGGAAATGTVLVATDRRTSGAQLEDEGIELRAASRVRANLGSRVRVNVTSYNRQVLLTGEAPNLQDKQLVEQVVSRVENVTAVVNELALLSTPSLVERSADTLVTGRVKAAILDAKDLQVNAFKVVTERGVTFLMGRVTQREADRATEVARAIPGVQKVVRIFEIISEDELRVLQPSPKKPSSTPATVP